MKGLVRSVTTLATLAFLAACQGGITPPGDNGIPPLERPPVGTAEETATGESSFSTAGQGAGEAGGRTSTDAAGTAGAAAPTAAGAGGGASNPVRAIEESDIVKAFGNHLYVLNAYRGLQVIDLTTPDSPRLVSRVPFYGRPVEMYVRDGNAYVLVSDYYRWWRRADDTPGVFHGSTLTVVNVQTPAQPFVKNRFEFPGEVEDSRIVGSVLYVVSNEYSWYYRYWDNQNGTQPVDRTTVVSVNIADPANIVKVDEKNFPSNGYQSHINVTQEGIFLAQSEYNWQNCSTNRSSCYQAAITYLDITDPAGTIRMGASFKTDGWVMDRWSMDRYGDTFRLITTDQWSSGLQTLRTFKFVNRDTIQPLGKLEINTGNERLTAARFDRDRGYLVTAQNYDPLWTVDLADPARPTLKGQLEMPGFLMHIEPRGDRLVALGIHTENNNAGNVARNFAVSLFNVADLAHPTLIKREIFGADGWGWLPGDRDDFQKIFKVLDDMGLILIPWQVWKRSSYSYESGVQMMDFTADTLTKRGNIRGVGSVLRAMPFASRILTIGNEKFQVVDATDRDNPVTKAVIDLARNVHSFDVLDGTYALQFAGSWIEGDTELVVTRVDDPNAASPVARIHVGAPNAKYLRNGNLAYVASSDSESQATKIQVVDFSTPTAPRLRGSLTLPRYTYISPYYWDYWGYGNEIALVNGTTIVFHRNGDYRYVCDGVGGRSNCHYDRDPHELTIVDASDPDAPALASTVQLQAQWAWGLKARGTYAYLTHYDYMQGIGTRYFLNRIDLSNPRVPVVRTAVNIPGQFLEASADGRYIYTMLSEYSGGQSTTKFYALALIGDAAYLRSTTSIPGYNYWPRFSNGFFYTVSYDYSRANSRGNPGYYLQIVDVRNPRAIAARGSAVTTGYGWLVGAENGYAFVSDGYMNGLSIYDVSNPDRPVFDRAFRTQGWVERVTIAGGVAHFASGYYGVESLALWSLPTPTVIAP
ncbi:MAG: beta-propeller domain-containing protein [Deltaproteobacteria bacterium]|nr:beta-propeller domain-containing protein [Deltaproteobacteria bacterium]